MMTAENILEMLNKHHEYIQDGPDRRLGDLAGSRRDRGYETS